MKFDVSKSLDALTIPRVYMHTIDGAPAYFDGDQICGLGGDMFLYEYQVFVSDFYAIKRQRNKTKKFRELNGMKDYHKYGHVSFRTER